MFHSFFCFCIRCLRILHILSQIIYARRRRCIKCLIVCGLGVWEYYTYSYCILFMRDGEDTSTFHSFYIFFLYIYSYCILFMRDGEDTSTFHSFWPCRLTLFLLGIETVVMQMHRFLTFVFLHISFLIFFLALSFDTILSWHWNRRHAEDASFSHIFFKTLFVGMETCAYTYIYTYTYIYIHIHIYIHTYILRPAR